MKKIIMLAMALALVFGLAVMGVSAEEVPVFNVGDRTAVSDAWSYNSETQILTVKGDMVITGSSEEDISLYITADVEVTLRNLTAQNKGVSCVCGSDVFAYYDFMCDGGDGHSVTVILEGENTVTVFEGADDYENDNAFAYFGGDIVFKGEGALNTNGCISANNSITVKGGVIDCESYIYDRGNITVSGGVIDCESYIYADDGDITVSGGAIDCESYIYADDGDITVSGGAIDCEGDIDAYEGDITVSDGVINCEGDIYADEGGITVSGGKLNAVNLHAYNASVTGGEVNVSSSLVVGSLGSNDYDEPGVFTISGGKVTAGVIAAAGVVQTGGKVETTGYYIDDLGDMFGLLIEGTYTISGGCLTSKAVESPEIFGDQWPETVSAFLIEDGLVVNAPAVLLSGVETVVVEEDVSATVIEGDLHICTPYAITAKAENGTVEAPASAFHGETVEFKATAKEGYELKSLTVNGEAVEGNSFTMPEADVEIVATFEKIPVKNPPTGDMNITFMLALTAVAFITLASIKKIKSM